LTVTPTFGARVRGEKIDLALLLASLGPCFGSVRLLRAVGKESATVWPRRLFSVPAWPLVRLPFRRKVGAIVWPRKDEPLLGEGESSLLLAYSGRFGWDLFGASALW